MIKSFKIKKNINNNLKITLPNISTIDPNKTVTNKRINNLKLLNPKKQPFKPSSINVVVFNLSQNQLF